MMMLIRSGFIFGMLISLLVAFSFVVQAQTNLVPNPSFEIFSNCPTIVGSAGNQQIIFATPWTTAGPGVSPDYFNACHNANPASTCFNVGVPTNLGGTTPARTGVAYAGIATYNTSVIDAREYIQIALNSPLQMNRAYEIEFFTRRAPHCSYAMNKMGLLVSTGNVLQLTNTSLLIPPTVVSTNVISDTNQWISVSGLYIASGGENFITIGNFDSDAATIISNAPPITLSSCPLIRDGAYYFIEDVSVIELQEQVFITGDTLICYGDTTPLFANANIPIWWSTVGQPNDTISTDSILYVSPNNITTYILNGLLVKDSITVELINPPSSGLPSDTSFCEKDNIVLDASNPGSTYNWSTGSTSSSIDVDTEGIFYIEMDNGGCIRIDSIFVDELSNPDFDLGSEATYCNEFGNVLILTGPDSALYFWQPSAEMTQSIMVTEENLFTCHVVWANGCKNSAEIETIEVCPTFVFVPSAFTPNDDGLNDVFLPKGYNIIRFQMQIYTRHGQLIFKTNDINIGWDGKFENKDVPINGYVYFIKYTSLSEEGKEVWNEKGGHFFVLK